MSDFSRSDKELAEGWRRILTDTIEYGLADDVWGFKIRPGYAYRCGNCVGVGVNYKTENAAKRGAQKHAGEQHPRSTVKPAPERDTAECSTFEMFDYEALARFEVNGTMRVVNGQWAFAGES